MEEPEEKKNNNSKLNEIKKGVTFPGKGRKDKTCGILPPKE